MNHPPKSPEDALRLLSASWPAAWVSAEPVIRGLNAAGFEAWLVGGSVRDRLIGREGSDHDVATNARPEQVMEIFDRVVATGLRHGTVTVLVDGHPVEVTTFRTEGDYTDARRPDSVNYVETMEEDLGRRDFTMNAMAFEPTGPRFLDPYDGLSDLRRGRIRAVGEALTRFREDGLRPFRAARFAAMLGFEPDPAVVRAIGGALGEASRVAPERIREELNRLLLAPRPSAGIEILRESGLLAVVIPELLEGYGVTQNRYHAFDVYGHTLAVLDHAVPRLEVRLAALFHDIAKPRTKVVVNGDGTFYNHQHVGAGMTRNIMTRLRYSNDLIETVTRLVDNHMFHYQPEWSDAAVRRFLRKIGPDLVADLFDLRIADSQGHGTAEGFPANLDALAERVNAELEKGSALSVSDLALNGGDVMRLLGMDPGPGVGEVLRFLLEKVTDDPGLNTPEGLEPLVQDFHRNMS